MIRFSLCIASSFILSTQMISACPPDESSQPQSAVLLSAVHEEPSPRVVELAICLDTSGSMNGLIEAAKIKLWDIVNDLATAKPTPTLKVALLTYGNDGHNPENGWVNVDSPLTEDLDLISSKLFALTTNGGTELVGRVVRAAGEQLQWTASDSALKLIVVAGNESADQDRLFGFRDVCRSVIAKGVMVNSIYCGNPADDIAPAWKEVATLTDGHFACIDHNNGTVIVSTPFDDELATLSASLNTTYVPYGERGQWHAENQIAQDFNASSISTAVAAQRCATKGGSLYNNDGWDLVDACKQTEFKLEDVKDEQLPESMRPMTPEQRRDYVKQMETTRGEIQSKVTDLNQKRQAFVEAEMKKASQGNDTSFDAAIRKAIRSQAQSKGFAFEPLKPVEVKLDLIKSAEADDGC